MAPLGAVNVLYIKIEIMRKRIYRYFMVAGAGFEPTTFGL